MHLKRIWQCSLLESRLPAGSGRCAESPRTATIEPPQARLRESNWHVPFFQVPPNEKVHRLEKKKQIHLCSFSSHALNQKPGLSFTDYVAWIAGLMMLFWIVHFAWIIHGTKIFFLYFAAFSPPFLHYGKPMRVLSCTSLANGNTA